MMGPTDCENWDRCQRRWVYLYHWQPIRVTPLGAVYQSLREYLEADTVTEAKVARHRVMALAGERGVYTSQPSPYDVMVNHAHLAEMLAISMRQPSDGPRDRHKPVQIGAVSWVPEAYLEPGGQRLMRFVLVDHWGDDRQSAELHSWRTVGDICVTGLPMTIRVLVIGQSRNGRRSGHWTRARQHPRSKQIRFARVKGREEGFAESWGWVWREESQVPPGSWLEQMARDKVLSEVAFNVQVRVPGEYQRARVIEDIQAIAERMQNAPRDGSQLPLTRSSCDLAELGSGGCRFQCSCLAPLELSVEGTGLFRRRT